MWHFIQCIALYLTKKKKIEVINKTMATVCLMITQLILVKFDGPKERLYVIMELSYIIQMWWQSKQLLTKPNILKGSGHYW